MKRTMIHDCLSGISACAELYKTLVQFSDEKIWYIAKNDVKI